MTTKEQERKALEQIRKIVAGLGEDSYIGTAFEGCFEIAADNIESDFACSMKQRVEAAEKARDAYMKKAGELCKEIDKLNQTIRNQHDSIDGIVAEMKKAKHRAIYPQLYITIRNDYSKRIETCRALMAQAANVMADVDPMDIAFAAAVKEYKDRRAEIENAEQVISELDRISKDEQ